MNDAARAIERTGLEPILAKVDIKRAYCNLPREQAPPGHDMGRSILSYTLGQGLLVPLNLIILANC